MSSEDIPGLTRLDAYPPGRRGTVVRVDADFDLAARMKALGILPGRRIRVIRRAPLRGPLQVRCGQTDLILRRDDARHIHVCPYTPSQD
jgi:ferrous iron transport protein A